MEELNRPNLSLIKCEGHNVGIGVIDCKNQVLVGHYGTHPQNDGSDSLCEDCEFKLMKKLTDNKPQ